MDWLRAYEGARGVGYLMVLVSLIAPTTLAFYLLEPAEFNERPWPASILLIASVGGFLNAFTVAGVMGKLIVSAMIAEGSGRTSPRNVLQTVMVQSLIIGHIAGLCIQAVALLVCVDSEYNLRTYLAGSFGGALGFFIVITIYSTMHEWRNRSRIDKFKAAIDTDGSTPSSAQASGESSTAKNEDS